MLVRIRRNWNSQSELFLVIDGRRVVAFVRTRDEGGFSGAVKVYIWVMITMGMFTLYKFIMLMICAFFCM